MALLRIHLPRVYHGLQNPGGEGKSCSWKRTEQAEDGPTASLSQMPRVKAGRRVSREKTLKGLSAAAAKNRSPINRPPRVGPVFSRRCCSPCR